MHPCLVVVGGVDHDLLLPLEDGYVMPASREEPGDIEAEGPSADNRYSFSQFSSVPRKPHDMKFMIIPDRKTEQYAGLFLPNMLLSVFRCDFSITSDGSSPWPDIFSMISNGTAQQQGLDLLRGCHPVLNQAGEISLCPNYCLTKYY